MRIIAIPLTLLMVLGVSVSSQAASNDEHRGLQRTGSCSFDPWLDNVPDHIRTIETGLYDYIKIRGKLLPSRNIILKLIKRR